jgi:hypothetical protein
LPTEGTYMAGCLQKAIELVPYDQLVSLFAGFAAALVACLLN